MSFISIELLMLPHSVRLNSIHNFVQLRFNKITKNIYCIGPCRVHVLSQSEDGANCFHMLLYSWSPIDGSETVGVCPVLSLQQPFSRCPGQPESIGQRDLFRETWLNQIYFKFIWKGCPISQTLMFRGIKIVTHNTGSIADNGGA